MKTLFRIFTKPRLRLAVLAIAVMPVDALLAQDNGTPQYPPGSEVGGIPVGVSGSGVYYIPDGGESVNHQGLAYNEKTGVTRPGSI